MPLSRIESGVSLSGLSEASESSQDVVVFPPCCPGPSEKFVPWIVLFKMLSCLFNMIKAILFTFLGLLRKILCFWKKSNRKSHSDDHPKLDSGAFQSQKYGSGQGDEASWESWDDNPTEIVIGGSRAPETVADHISVYRSNLQRARQKREEEEERVEPEADLFSELTPEVKHQKKVYVGPPVASKGPRRQSGRLSMQDSEEMDPAFVSGDQLDDWDHKETSGWEVEDDEISEVLREQRRQNKQRLQS